MFRRSREWENDIRTFHAILVIMFSPSAGTEWERTAPGFASIASVPSSEVGRTSQRCTVESADLWEQMRKG